MRELSIKEIIKALPIDKDVKLKLIEGYDAYPEDIKTEVVHECYGAFSEYLDLLQRSKEELFMKEVAEGKRTLNSSFRDDVEKAAWDEIESRLNGTYEDDEELAHVRARLQSIITSTQQN